MSIRIIGTGHIFELSVKEVRNAIVEDKPDIVAVELDEKRYWALEEQGFSTDLPDEAFSLGVVLRETVRGGVTSCITAGVFVCDTEGVE